MDKCEHFKDGNCVTKCTCNGVQPNCEFLIGENDGSYKFLLEQVMKLMGELDEHLTCSLPCIYCKQYGSEKMCNGKFEWIYQSCIDELLGKEK